ncbi:MAG TPA: WbuC family cupin fold metalloprotein [Polyangiaceae bacterium]|nr:WbuC family cupin fold metalloprotein [Polyangiaceae bacterium]
MSNALPPPTGRVVWITEQSLERTISAASWSPRARMIQPFHRSAESGLHRMFNAVQPGSYIAPHRHLEPPKDESWIVLRGALAFFTFDEQGVIEECLEVRAGSDVFGVDLEPGVYHTFFALEPGTVVYEVKTGPYAPNNDKSFAPWAPREGEPGVAAYLGQLEREFAARASAKSE